MRTFQGLRPSALKGEGVLISWRGPRLPGEASAAEPHTAFLSHLESGGAGLSLVKLPVDVSFFDLYMVEVHCKGGLSWGK